MCAWRSKLVETKSLISYIAADTIIMEDGKLELAECLATNTFTLEHMVILASIAQTRGFNYYVFHSLF